MTERTVAGTAPEAEGFRMELDEIARQGAQKMLKDMLEADVQHFIERNADSIDESGHRHVVRNGHLPSREVLTGVGPLNVAQPRARDRRGVSNPDSVSFTPKILPPYLRRSKNMDELIPWLYLKGI